MVDPGGLEPPTSSVQTRRSSAELGAQKRRHGEVTAVGCYGYGFVKGGEKRRTPAWDQAGVPEEASA